MGFDILFGLAKLNVSAEYRYTDLGHWASHFILRNCQQELSGSRGMLVELTESDEAHEVWVKSAEHVCLEFPWSKHSVPPKFLPFYLSQLGERLLQEQGLHSLACSAVIMNGLAVLFVGDFWQGKSTVALNLVQTYDHVALVSDHRVILKSGVIVDASRSLSIQSTSFYRKHQNDIMIDGRIYRSDQASQFTPLRVGAIVHFTRDPTYSETEITSSDMEWYLFQKTSTLIRGAAILFNGARPSASLDNQDLAQWRLRMIQETYGSVPFIRLRTSSINSIMATLRNVLAGD